MAKFNKIQVWLLEKNLQKRMAGLERNKKFHNLKTATSFAVVFDASSEKNYNRVGSFIRHLQSKNKQVKGIGFIDYKTMPHYVLQTLSYDFILKKDLNFFLRPGNKFINDFLSTEYDVLVDFNLEENPVLRYLTALSKAQFKMGIYDERNKDIFDFMIQGIDNHNTAQYAKEVLNFLESLDAGN